MTDGQAKKKVLVTGSSGLIGGVVIRTLRDKYDFHGLDAHRSSDAPDVPTTLADASDFDAIRPAFEGMDAVVHLAADPNMHGAWGTVLHNNLVPTYNVFEAAKQAGARRVVFASSNHAVGMWELEGAAAKIRVGDYTGLDPDHVPQIDKTVQIRPDGYYGISKAFGEATGSYYADNFGMEVACLRIGTVSRPNDPKANIRMRATWLSHRDIAQLVDRCLSAPNLKFDIFYGVSNNKWRFWDIEHARRTIGFNPEDNAEDHWTEK